MPKPWLIALSGLPDVGKTTIARLLAAAAIGRDNLALGLDVIADSASTVQISRQLWAVTVEEAGATLINVDLICSDAQEHRRRVETRTNDMEGLRLPRWAEVKARVYDPWPDPPFQLDTAYLSASNCAEQIVKHCASLSNRA